MQNTSFNQLKKRVAEIYREKNLPEQEPRDIFILMDNHSISLLFFSYKKESISIKKTMPCTIDEVLAELTKQINLKWID